MRSASSTTVQMSSYSTSKSKAFALINACKQGNISKVWDLLQKGHHDVNLSDHRRNTALMYAVDEGHVEIVEALLSRGANVNAKNGSHHNAVFFAVNSASKCK